MKIDDLEKLGAFLLRKSSRARNQIVSREIELTQKMILQDLERFLRRPSLMAIRGRTMQARRGDCL